MKNELIAWVQDVRQIGLEKSVLPEQPQRSIDWTKKRIGPLFRDGRPKVG